MKIIQISQEIITVMILQIIERTTVSIFWTIYRGKFPVQKSKLYLVFNLFVSQNQKYEFTKCGVTNCLHIVSYHHVMNYMLTCSLTRDRGVYNDLIRLGAPSEVSVSHLNCVIVPTLIHWRYQPATSRLSKDRVLVQLVEKQQQIFVT